MGGTQHVGAGSRGLGRASAWGVVTDVPRPQGCVDVWTCVIRCATAGPSTFASYASPSIGCEVKGDSEG